MGGPAGPARPYSTCQPDAHPLRTPFAPPSASQLPPCRAGPLCRGRWSLRRRPGSLSDLFRTRLSSVSGLFRAEPPGLGSCPDSPPCSHADSSFTHASCLVLPHEKLAGYAQFLPETRFCSCLSNPTASHLLTSLFCPPSWAPSLPLSLFSGGILQLCSTTTPSRSSATVIPLPSLPF
jgi:hypothetical protein